MRLFRRRQNHKGFEAVPAVMVADETNQRGKRLGYLAIALLLLFFAISSYVQSAQNGAALRQSAHERGQLIGSVEYLTQSNRTQSRYIRQLLEAIREQNRILRQAGIATIPVPQTPSCCAPEVEPRPQPKPSQSPKSNPKPTNRPSPTPRPTVVPSPSPEPSDIRKTVCRTTHICLPPIAFVFYRFF